MSFSHLINKVRGQPESYHRKVEYDFGEPLGAGAFSVVRRAKDLKNNREVAIKIMLRERIRDPEQVVNELHLLSQLSHPHIVRLIDYFESKHKFYVVTELCTGGELFERIIEQGRFDETVAAQRMRDVAEALDYLHDRDIVHRDVKPENLLYKSHDQDSPLLLTDFGVAKELTNPKERITSAAGSLGYAAPEVFEGNGHGKPCDVWSLGVVIFTVLSGYSPFAAESAESFMREVGPGFIINFPPQYWGSVSKDAKDLISRMIVYDPAKRLTMGEVLLHPWLAPHLQHSTYDLLPTVREGLSARRRWLAAFEKIRIAQRIRNLGMENENDDDASSKFLSIVAAAQEQKYREQENSAPPTS